MSCGRSENGITNEDLSTSSGMSEEYSVGESIALSRLCLFFISSSLLASMRTAFRLSSSDLGGLKW